MSQQPPPPYGPPPGYAAGPGYPPLAYPAPGYPDPAYPAPAYPGQPVAPGYGFPAADPAQNFTGPAAPVPAQGYPGGPPPPPGPMPTAWPQPGQLAMLSCRLCGSVPAVDTTFRGHQGMLVMFRISRFPGPFCRDCGLGTFRHMTGRTLLQGWYSYGSLIIAPITLLINVVRRNKVASLPQPQPNPYGPSRHPMDPGKPLLARPLTWVGLGIPFALLALFVVIVSTSN